MSDTWSPDPHASHSFGRIPRLATYVDEILCVDSPDLGCGARVMRQWADEFGGRIGTPAFGLGMLSEGDLGTTVPLFSRRSGVSRVR